MWGVGEGAHWLRACLICIAAFALAGCETAQQRRQCNRRLAPNVHMPSNPHTDEIWQQSKEGKPQAAQKSFDLRTLLPIHRKKTALPIPAVLPEEPAVYFIWRNAEANGHFKTLRDICELVTYIGRSRSLVRVSIAEDAPAATHAPDPLGQIQLRVPGGNRLEQLEDFYKRKGESPIHPRRAATDASGIGRKALRRSHRFLIACMSFGRSEVIRPFPPPAPSKSRKRCAGR